MSRASPSSRCACPRIRPSVSRPSCAPPTCCCRSRARPRPRPLRPDPAAPPSQILTTGPREGRYHRRGLMKSLRSILALGAFFVVLATAIAGCGSSSTGVPSDSVAVVAGNPITTKAFKPWMFVAAQGQAAQSPGSPVIIPDPPNYTKCVADARKDIPSLAKTPAKTLKTDCSQLFTTLSGQVMDFLIKAYWYQADAHKLGINITDA